MKIKIIIVIALGMFFLMQVAFGEDMYPFPTPKQSEQFQSLTKEIRCVVCQNQSIADSRAPLAIDLRNQVYRMLQSRQSPEEIKSYLIARYGESILFEPRFNQLTASLWILPLIMMFFAILLLKKLRQPAKQG